MNVTSNPPSTAAPEQDSSVILSSHDRCDACSSQAYVAVDLGSGRLLFCGHHYQQHEVALATVAVAVRDERYRLDEVS